MAIGRSRAMERGLAPGSEEHGSKAFAEDGAESSGHGRASVRVGVACSLPAQEDRMSSELDDNPSRWDEPVDRRTALAAAGGVGAALALGGLAGANRAFAGPAQNAGNVTAFFGQFGADRRAGGHPQVRVPGLQGRRRRDLRPDHQSHRLRRPRTSGGQGRGRETSTSSSACTATSSRSRTRTSSAASTTWPGR